MSTHDTATVVRTTSDTVILELRRKDNTKIAGKGRVRTHNRAKTTINHHFAYLLERMLLQLLLHTFTSVALQQLQEQPVTQSSLN
jgi:hypothetical protein